MDRRINGLYTYQLQNRKLSPLGTKRNGLPHNTIYSIIRTGDNQIYVGTYNGLCRYIASNGKFEKIPLPVNSSQSNLFVNSLLEDTGRQCIWIGTEGYLFQYFPSTGQMKQTEAFHNNSIKSLALDGNGYLLAGTDNGLYVYHNDVTPLQHIIHDSRNIQSLTNNIIWNIFADQEHNIGWAPTTAFPFHATTAPCNLFRSHRLQVRETEISSTPYSATQKVSTGLEVPTD